MALEFPARQKRKAANRRRIVAAARDLFLEQGYDTTTLDAIADQAGLHVNTVYLHFRTKLELAAATDEEGLEDFRAMLTDPERKGSAIECWRGYIHNAASEAMSKNGGQGYFQFLRDYRGNHPFQLGLQYRRLLTDALYDDVDIEDGYERQETARVIATALWGALEHTTEYALEHAANTHGQAMAFDLVTSLSEGVDRVERLFKTTLRN